MIQHNERGGMLYTRFCNVLGGWEEKRKSGVIIPDTYSMQGPVDIDDAGFAQRHIILHTQNNLLWESSVVFGVMLVNAILDTLPLAVF